MSKPKIKYDTKLRSSESKTERLGLLSKKVNFSPKSFRFTDEDMIILNSLTKRLNGKARIKINATKVLQVLLHHCKDLKEDKLMESLRALV